MGVGLLCFVLVFIFLCVLSGMGPNQKQLSIVVSDWEPYLGSLFSHFWVVGGYFPFQCFHHTGLFRFSFILLFFVFCVQCNKYDEHLPRCILVRYFLLLLRRGRRQPLHTLMFSVLLCFLVCFTRKKNCIFKVVGMLCKSNDTNPPAKSILFPGCKATK